MGRTVLGMRPFSCLLGRHRWRHHRNPEVGGALADYEVCGRCGKERPVWDKPSSGGVSGWASG